MKLTLLILVILAMSISALGQSATGEVSKYKSDRCTWFPDGDYADCCAAHDQEYFVGGGLKARLASDKRLRKCVLAKGGGFKRKLLANAMFVGVRIGGVPFLPTPFRWGFGNKWPKMRPFRGCAPAY